MQVTGIATVERRQTKTGKTMFWVNIGDVKMSSFDADVMKANGQKIDAEYEVNGNFKNLKEWSFVADDSNIQQGQPQQQQQHNQPPVSYVTEDARQQSITRQSAMNQAVNLVAAMLTSGNLPFPSTGKNKGTVKDTAVVLALVFDTAKEIKEFVANGKWEVVSEEDTPQPADQQGEEK